MVTMHDRDRTDPSYRLLNSRSTETADLIAPDGEVVRKWTYEQGFSWHYAEMLENGNLVAIAKDRMILEIGADMQVVWEYRTNAHHDFARCSNGNTYVVSGRPDHVSRRIDPERAIYLDHIEEVTPDGRVEWVWRPEEHVVELAGLVDLILPPSSFNDWPHLNTIEILPENPTAVKDSRFRKGNLLLCGRHIDTVFVVDRETSSIVWAWGPGKILGPHMPTMLENGNLLIYDNGQNTSRVIRGFTRIIELDPLSGEICWKYAHPGGFYSPSRGSAERLPNGNCLIAHSDSGRLFEVTMEGVIVWEYLNDVVDSFGRRDPVYRTKHYRVAR